MKPKKNEEASIYMDSAIIAGVVFLIITVYVWKRVGEDEKMGIDSDEKRLIATAVRTRSCGEEKIIPLYAYHDITIPSKHYKKKNYLYYAVGVSEERVYVTQFRIVDGNISFEKTNIIEKSTVKWLEGYDSYSCTMGFVFNFYNGEKFVCFFDESNIKADDGCPVNIQQKKEMQEAYEILSRWMKQVNCMKDPIRPRLTKASKVFYGIAKISLVIGVLGIIVSIISHFLVNRGMDFSEVGRYSTILISLGFFLAFFSGMLGLLFESSSKGYV